MTLAQAACLASCNGVNVTLAHHGTFTIEDFRKLVQRVTSGDGEHLIVSYTRRDFKQTGDGHFSPIGGYHPGQDHVLILDVARFKYPPHWVPLQLLFDAMAAHDTTTGALFSCVCCISLHLVICLDITKKWRGRVKTAGKRQQIRGIVRLQVSPEGT